MDKRSMETMTAHYSNREVTNEDFLEQNATTVAISSKAAHHHHGPKREQIDGHLELLRMMETSTCEWVHIFQFRPSGVYAYSTSCESVAIFPPIFPSSSKFQDLRSTSGMR
jgi:hypothetical protein